MEKIEIIASLNVNKKCIGADGDGASTITFDADATQLAQVLLALPTFHNKPIKLTLEALSKDYQNAGQESSAQTIR